MPAATPSPRTRRLVDDTAYITGGSSGIGAACALELARAGARVYLGARRMDRLIEVKDRIDREVPGAEVKIGLLDVTSTASVDEWIEAGRSQGPCSILVNNAGLAVGRASVVDSKLADWDTMLEVNVRAAFAITKKLLPTILARPHGDVVMMGSVAGSEPYANGAIYCASKAAMHAFSRSLRAELLGKDVRVLCFDPGMVETEFSTVRMGGDADAAKKIYAGMTPLTPEDVADCVLFALTRPRHVSLDRMLILATAQLGTQAVHRA